MGIPLYFHTITNTYTGILHTSKPRKCNWYFFDYNGAIHHAAQNVIVKRENVPVAEVDNEAFEKEIYEEVWDYTGKCVGVADPQNKIGIYIDGVAPIAKINQQRKRRYLSILRHKLMETTPVWDTNAISPGTAFMIRLQAFLRRKIQEDVHQMKYMLSSADEAGEGEHKIFAQIASIPPLESIFIHGLDADLIMLSLMSHHPNITLMREPTWPYNTENTAEGFIYLDIDKFRSGLLSHLRDQYKWSIADESVNDPYSEEAKRIIETYVVLCFLLGNDFLPHAPTLSLKKNGYEDVLRAAKEAYAIYPFGCVVDQRVFIPFITEVILRLAVNEDTRLLKANEEYMRRKPSIRADKADAYPLLDETRDKLAKLIYDSSQPNRWRSLYYKHLFFTKLNDTNVIAKACEQYVTGLCWTYAYYKRLPKPYDWYYPYGYPPSLLDIANFLQGTPDANWEKLQMHWYEYHKASKFLDPSVQLLCILPIGSMKLLPYKYREWMTNPKYGISFMFPSQYNVQTYMHTHLWECVPVLPPLDIPWILRCIDEV